MTEFGGSKMGNPIKQVRQNQKFLTTQAKRIKCSGLVNKKER